MESLDRSELKLAPPEIGTIVGSRYRVVEKLGEGGMGAVYKAEHVQMGKTVALKMLLASFDPDTQSSRRFLQEAKAASQLNHPNIVNIYDFDIDQTRAFLAMDYLDGTSLDSVIEEQGPLPIPRLLPIVQQACRALAYAHKQGFVHRDVKPSNMMLVNRGDESDVLIIVDFGLVKAIAEESEQKLTTSQVIVGSPLFMSPEQCRSQPVDHRSDIYSLGLVLYRCLTGAYGVAGENFLDTMCKHIVEPVPSMASVNPNVVIPPAVEAVVMKAIAKDPAKRFQSMQELLSAFSEAAVSSGAVSQSTASVLVSSSSNQSAPGFAMGQSLPKPHQSSVSSSVTELPTLADMKLSQSRVSAVSPSRNKNVAAWAFASVAVLVLGTVLVFGLLVSEQQKQIALEEDKIKLQTKQQEAQLAKSQEPAAQPVAKPDPHAAEKQAAEAKRLAAELAAKAKKERFAALAEEAELRKRALAFETAGDEALRARNFDGALNNYQQSVAATKQVTGGDSDPEFAVVLGHMAICDYELGDKSALNNVLDNLSAFAKTHPKALLGQQKLVLELAELAELNHKDRLSEFLFSQAIRQRESQISGSKDWPLFILYLSEARVLLRDNNSAQAAVAVDDAIQVADGSHPMMLMGADAVRKSLNNGNTERALEILERMNLDPGARQSAANIGKRFAGGQRFGREPR